MKRRERKAKIFHRLQAAIVECVASRQHSLQEISSVANMVSIGAAEETEAMQSVCVTSVHGLAATRIRNRKIKPKRLKKVSRKKRAEGADANAKKKKLAKDDDSGLDSDDTCLDDSTNNPVHIKREDLAKLN